MAVGAASSSLMRLKCFADFDSASLEHMASCSVMLLFMMINIALLAMEMRLSLIFHVMWASRLIGYSLKLLLGLLIDRGYGSFYILSWLWLVEYAFGLIGSAFAFDQFRFLLINLTTSYGAVGGIIKSGEWDICLYATLANILVILSCGVTVIPVTRTNLSLFFFALCIVLSVIFLIVALAVPVAYIYPCMPPGYF